jgi:hypothetical protein
MTPETEALLAFDVDEVLAEAARSAAARTPEELARLEAAEFLVDRGCPADARLAARWLLGMVA